MTDPDRSDTAFITDYVFVLREDGHISVQHDRHVVGVFPRETWLRVLTSAGFSTERAECIDEGRAYDVFVARRL